ncbi:MAG: soxA [Hyphomicrobiales bacterium]|nr:soxA [Hyphomicrobiales bacterium]
MSWRARGLALALLGLAGAVGARADIPAGERKSGALFMSKQTQAMQADDTANPGMLAAAEGEGLWNASPAPGGKSCAQCHGAAETAMKGVAARYPAVHEASGRVVDLDGRINVCRQEKQNASPLARESRELLALSAYVGLQSRGLAVAPPDDARLAAARERGRALWETRMGQLNFSCAQCHDDNWGKHLGSAPIPQAHANAYPIYRLEWQGMGSLQRRLRNCMSGVRGEPFALGSPEFIDLEAFLAARAQGMPVETPGVRP